MLIVFLLNGQGLSLKRESLMKVKWLITEGGWESEKTVEYFARYCGYVAGKLGDLMGYVCTLIMKAHQAAKAAMKAVCPNRGGHPDKGILLLVAA